MKIKEKGRRGGGGRTQKRKKKINLSDNWLEFFGVLTSAVVNPGGISEVFRRIVTKEQHNNNNRQQKNNNYQKKTTTPTRN